MPSALPHPTPCWDIFCTVVDNFGDIGVTWRLARQLVAEYGLHVRLWVDDLASFARICPDLDPDLPYQSRSGVHLCHWPATFPAGWQAGEVVIEAFACELPEAVKRAMSQRVPVPLWLNLEYLSAETWIDDCHLLPSHQGQWGLTKYFYFPGFSPRSGGLICERDLAAQRAAWQADPRQQARFWAGLGLSPPAPRELSISLFTYETPALPALFEAWSQGTRPIRCLVPVGRSLGPLLAWLGETQGRAGDHWRRGALSVHLLPMTDQAGYDRLLWSCDLNLVRGEDSFLRAQWAARPFIWHIYPQEEGVHLEKLDAFLARYTASLAPAAREAQIRLSHAFNQGQADAMASAWPAWLAQLDSLQALARRWPAEVLAGGDLASRLVQFARNRLKCGV